MGKLICMLKRCRTEHARKVRRETGTNAFADKQLVFSGKDVSSTLTANFNVDNLICEYGKE